MDPLADPLAWGLPLSGWPWTAPTSNHLGGTVRLWERQTTSERQPDRKTDGEAYLGTGRCHSSPQHWEEAPEHWEEAPEQSARTELTPSLRGGGGPTLWCWAENAHIYRTSTPTVCYTTVDQQHLQTYMCGLRKKNTAQEIASRWKRVILRDAKQESRAPSTTRDFQHLPVTSFIIFMVANDRV